MSNVNSVGRVRKMIGFSDLVVMLAFVAVLVLIVMSLWAAISWGYLGIPFAVMALAFSSSVVSTKRANTLEQTVCNRPDSEYFVDDGAIATIEQLRVRFPKFAADYLSGLDQSQTYDENELVDLLSKGIEPDLGQDIKAIILKYSTPDNGGTGGKKYRLSDEG